MMSELGKWCIEGRDVFIERYSVNNGIETMTKEEAEAKLNEYAKLLQAVNDKDQELYEAQELITELLEALERTEQTMRNLASNLTGDLRIIAQNETFNIREALSKAKEK